MMNVEQLENIAAQLEDLLIRIADGENSSRNELIQLLKILEQPDPATLELLSENIDMILPEVDDARLPEVAELTLWLARRGVDTPRIRDALSIMVRHNFSHYADPAGIQDALELRNQECPINECAERYLMFAELKEDTTVVWDDREGLGTLIKLDDIMNQVKIRFSAILTLDLKTMLTRMNVARNDSFAAMLVRGEGFDRRMPVDVFSRKLADSFIPRLRSPRPVVEAVLVPKFLGTGEFIAWLDRDFPEQKERTRTTTTPDKQAAAPKPPPRGTKITWANARSPEELILKLKKESSVTFLPEHQEHFRKLFRYTGTRQNFLTSLGHAIIALWEKCENKDELGEFYAGERDSFLVWTQRQAFCDFSISLKISQFNVWLPIVQRVCGTHWLVQQVIHLPLRFWNHLANFLAGIDQDPGIITEQTLHHLRNEKPSADPILWLWQKDRKLLTEFFSNPSFILDALRDKPSGEYLKAYNQLREKLFSDENFQKAVVHDGDPEILQAFLRTFQNSPVLDHGERQSLMVKLSRLFPQAKEFIESSHQKKQAPVRKISPISSYRSLKQFREELMDIIERQIPENSAAIAHARSYGDLRENFEYKAAKERQAYLAQRRSELEKMLAEVQPTDFSHVQVTDTIIPGCSVTLAYDDGTTETFHILGMLDSAPEKKIIAYATEFGQALLGRKVGESITLPNGKQITIREIKPLPDEIKRWVIE